MKTKIFLAITSFLTVPFFSCKYYSYGLDEFFYRNNTTDKRADCMKELDTADSPQSLPDKYSVILIADVHFGGENSGKNKERRDEAFFKAIAQLDEKPAFCICLGDVAEHGLEEEFKDYVEKITDGLYNKFNIKTYTVIGNHDLYNSGWKNYKKLVFPYTAFYHFKTNRFSWYFIDSASGSLGNLQFTKLHRNMECDNSPKLVFSHIPLYANGLFYFTMQNTVERNKIISVFNRNNVKAVVDGHTHIQSVSTLGNFREYTTGGYLEKYTFSVMNINETDGTVSCTQFFYADN